MTDVNKITVRGLSKADLADMYDLLEYVSEDHEEREDYEATGRHKDHPHWKTLKIKALLDVVQADPNAECGDCDGQYCDACEEFESTHPTDQFLNQRFDVMGDDADFGSEEWAERKTMEAVERDDEKERRNTSDSLKELAKKPFILKQAALDIGARKLFVLGNTVEEDASDCVFRLAIPLDWWLEPNHIADFGQGIADMFEALAAQTGIKATDVYEEVSRYSLLVANGLIPDRSIASWTE